MPTFDVTISHGRTDTGERDRKYRRFQYPKTMTKKQIEKQLAKDILRFEDEISSGSIENKGSMTVKSFIEMWREDYATKELAPKTLYRYDGLLKRIIPALGHYRLRELNDTHIRRFINMLRTQGEKETRIYIATPRLSEIMAEKKISAKALAEGTNLKQKTISSIIKGAHTNRADVICSSLGADLSECFTLIKGAENLSDQTIQHYYRLISTILNTAVLGKYIKENPAKFIKTPKVDRKEARSLDMAAIDSMLIALESEPIKYRAMIYTALCTGCRLGELSGLTWDRIDLEAGKMIIDRAAQYIPGKGVFIKSPKNRTSRRVVSMPLELRELLKEYKAWQDNEKSKLGDLWNTQRDDACGGVIDYVFTQREGKQIFPYTPTNWFRGFCKRHGLPRLKFHELRHTHATSLIDSGVDLQTVSSRLGHAKITTTTSIYAHKFRPTDEVAAEMFSAKILRHNEADDREKQ